MSGGHFGIAAALAAAFLFGASTPLAKLLLAAMAPAMLAGLLYLGAGVGLTLIRALRGSPARLAGSDAPWLAGAILCGGIGAPLLLMWGLAGSDAAGASLLLNAEGVFTALIAWFAFHENFDGRIALGMAAIVAGAVVLSWPANLATASLGRPLAILGACLLWAIDNNLTRRIALSDPLAIAGWKGLAAGLTNAAVASLAGAALPGSAAVLQAATVGVLAYGVSLALFVLALRHLGAARTGAYFSLAPFVGAILAVPLLGEPLTLRLLAAGGLMGLGLWLHLAERHEHEHGHEAMEHSHAHRHDDPHHQHEHAEGADTGPHVHPHRHEPVRHRHAHYPDAHHRHGH